MATSYLKRDATANSVIGVSFTAGSPLDTYGSSRFFTYIDLLSSGLTLAQISYVLFRGYIASVVSAGKTYRLRSDQGVYNWGTLLEANAADFESTDTNLESDKVIGSTGWVGWPVDKNNLDLNGKNWLRIASLSEGNQEISNVQISTQNSATNKPHLRVFLKGPGGIGIRAGIRRLGKLYIVQAGAGLKYIDYFGPTADGSITKTETVLTGDPPTPASP